MTDEREHPQPRKRHRLALGATGAVVVVAFGAPLAGAAGVGLPQPPIDVPDVPEAPDVPDLPEIEPLLPGVPPLPIPEIPEVTTLPVPVEELEGVTQPVTDVVGAVGDTVEDVTGEVDEVDEVVEEVDGGGIGVVDEVTGGGGTVGGIVDGVTGGGGVGGVVDGVTGGVTGPVEEVVDTATGAIEDVGGELGNNVGGIVDGVSDKVGNVVDGDTGGAPATPGTPGAEAPVEGGSGTGIAGGGRTANTTDTVAGTRTAIEPAAALSPDGFAGSGAVVTSGFTTGTGNGSEVSSPSFVERIAQSAADVAERIAFPMLLAFAVGAFVLVQNRVDRKDPKLALAALDAEEDLLGFE